MDLSKISKGKLIEGVISGEVKFGEDTFKLNNAKIMIYREKEGFVGVFVYR